MGLFDHPVELFALSLSLLVLVSVIGFRLRLQGAGTPRTKEWITTDRLILL